MAEDTTQEKTFDPTPNRVEEFRREGRVAQSKDIASAAQLAAALVAFGFAGQELLGATVRATAWTIEQAAAGGADGPTLTGALWAVVSVLLGPAVLVSLAMALAAVAATLAQTRLNWAPAALAFKPERLNPLSRLAETFSPQKLGTRALLAVGKIALGAAVIGVLMMEAMPGVAALALAPLSTADQFLRDHLGRMLFATVLVLSVMAALDYAYQKRELLQQMKMTREEYERDMKQQEGDPHYKRQRRLKHREISMNRIIEEVPRADVIVTNPTHLALALRYRPGEDRAPVVTARGADDLALHIRTLARRHGVPILENRPLARTLWRRAKVGQPIPATLYQAVAEVLARVYKIRPRRA